MAVSAEQVAALRTLLGGDFDEHRQIIARIGQAGAWNGYNELITAAFSDAVHRRFGQHYTLAGVVEFVAGVRTRFGNAGQEIDPGAAERLIRKALGESVPVGAGTVNLIHIEGVLLSALIMDAHLGSTELDAFIGEARAVADGWLARHPRQAADG